MQVSGVCVEPVSSDIILCINCWQKQALSWLEASWINNIQLSSSFCWLPTNWLLTVSELIWLMLPNIFLMMTEKKCSNVDKFTRTETFCGSDSANLILEPYFSVTIFSQVMALSRMIVYSTKRFMSPLRIEPSIWRATRGETSSIIVWIEESIYVRARHNWKENMLKKEHVSFNIHAKWSYLAPYLTIVIPNHQY